MIRFISLDMDGTLVNSKFVDLVWMHGVPELYAEKSGMDFEAAKEFVVGEYMKIGSDKLEWYNLPYWLEKFGLDADKWDLLRKYEDEIEFYPEVNEALDSLSGDYELIVTSNAAREFLEIELDGYKEYFRELFSVTSDFRDVKKSPHIYGAICKELDVKPFEVLHIGDHYTYDYESPLQAGLDALFLDRKGIRSGSEVVGNLLEAIAQIRGSA